VTIARPLLAVTLAVVLPAHAVPPGNAVIGVVTQAMDANLGTGSVSAGATVYDGDQLSTDEDGALTFRAQAATLYLSRQSAMVLYALPGRLNSAAAHLSAGTLVFFHCQLAILRGHCRPSANLCRYRCPSHRPSHRDGTQNPLHLCPPGISKAFFSR
jgi:hypothetical protein